MSDIVERLRAIRDGEEIERLATEIEEMRDDTQMLWDAVAEKNAEIERLRELLRGEGANRYWEGRWRDEKAENDRLRAEIKREAAA